MTPVPTVETLSFTCSQLYCVTEAVVYLLGTKMGSSCNQWPQLENIQEKQPSDQ